MASTVIKKIDEVLVMAIEDQQKKMKRAFKGVIPDDRSFTFVEASRIIGTKYFLKDYPIMSISSVKDMIEMKRVEWRRARNGRAEF